MHTRRRFISHVIATSASLVAPTFASIAAHANTIVRGTIIGPGAVDDEKLGKRRFYLGIVDLDAPNEEAVKTIETDFFAHGVSPDPINPERASLFQKQGSGACEVDLKSRTVLRPIETAKDRRFYGHGAYSPDGATLYCTETIMSDPNLKGIIAVRDAKSHDYLGEFPSYGAQPHDCQLLDDGKVIAVTNGGLAVGDENRGNVSFVEIETQKLLDQVVIESDRKNAGHLFVSPKGHLAIVSAERDGLDAETNTGGITLRPKGGQAKLLREPVEIVSKMFGETLSVYIDDERGIVAATTPVANLVTFWKIETGELVKFFNVTGPRGVTQTLDGKYWVISYSNAVLSLLDAETLEPAPVKPVFPSYMTGSHIIPYNLNAYL